jgi:ribosomal protein S18 acetylase RimI-like enzyme
MLIEMVHTLEENNAEFLLEMGRAGGGEEHLGDDIQWTAGGSPLDYHNAVVRATLTEERCNQEIAAFQAALTHHNTSGTWHLGPSMLPATLREHLLAQGFEHEGDEVGMGLDLRLSPIDSAIPHQFSMLPVRTLHHLHDYAEVLTQGFGEGEREARWVQAVFAHIGLDESNAWQHVVGYIERTPVATATLYFTGETVGLYFVATSPVWRRRGLGAAITAGALEIARQRQAQWAVLCASAMGYSVYRRAGFSDLANIGIYRWQPPAGHAGESKS